MLTEHLLWPSTILCASLILTYLRLTLGAIIFSILPIKTLRQRWQGVSKVTEQEDSVAWIQTSDLATQGETASLKEVSLEWKAKITCLYLFTWRARYNPEIAPPHSTTHCSMTLIREAPSQVSVPTPKKCWLMITQMLFSSVASWVQCKWTEEIWEHYYNGRHNEQRGACKVRARRMRAVRISSQCFMKCNLLHHHSDLFTSFCVMKDIYHLDVQVVLSILQNE